MKSVPLTAFPRSATRHGPVKKLRAAGRVPAVAYGRQIAPQVLEVVEKDLTRLIHQSASENLLVDLTVSGDARSRRLALVQEIQHHPLTGRVLHLDLHEVNENEKATITVAVEALGEAIGVKNGGILEHVIFKLRVRALPKDLPEVITVDVSGLEINKAVHLGEVVAPPGVEIIGDKTAVVFAVAEPITEAQETAPTAAEPAAAGEVEMLKEKKDEEGAKPEGKGKTDAKAEEKGGEKKAAEKKK